MNAFINAFLDNPYQHLHFPISTLTLLSTHWIICHSKGLDKNVDSYPASRLIDTSKHDDVMKWKHFPRYWPFVRRIHRYPMNSPHKGQWRGALIFSLICVWINYWVNNREAGDVRRYRAHYDVIVMKFENCRASLVTTTFVLGTRPETSFPSGPF